MNKPLPLKSLTTDDFRRVREVFESALQQPPDLRTRFVEQACAGDTTLMSEVQRMLTADAESCTLLDAGKFGEARLPVGGVFAGHFEIAGILGHGGMGEVYRGRDTNLQRSVALKILPAAFTRDPDRLSRFRREAQVLASLNHPNIGAIYSLEEENGVQALALELVEGPTLADRIQEGPIPLDEALPIARQIAEALEAAHEQGIIHRDLKPANVKLRPDGAVKVLDFGLAKSITAAESPRAGSEPPEITSPAMLAVGVLIGTPAYMAPEQARGRAADRRADIWAFGAVLYEMLSGRRAFPGEDLSETLASVLRHEVDWKALPSSTPAAVRTLIARCLERDPRQRLRDIGEARIILDSPTASAAPANPGVDTRWRFTALVLVAVVVGLLTGGAALYVNGTRSAPTQVARFSINLPNNQPVSTNNDTLAISADGAQIVFATPSGLYLRSLAEPEAKIIRGTEGLRNITGPAFSPDGRFIAFHTAGDQTLKRIPVTGGAALTICRAWYPTSVSWNPEGILYTAASEPLSRLPAGSAMRMAQFHRSIQVVQPDGGPPKTLVNPAKDQVVLRPQFLPGGRHLLYTLASATGANLWDNARIVAQDLQTGELVTVREGGSDGRYSPTGHLLYAVSGSLFAVPFDAQSLKTAGSVVPLIAGVMRSDPEVGGGVVHYAFADNGTLIYLPGPVSPRWDLAIADRSGQIAPLQLPSRPYESPRASPDGTRIAMHSMEGDQSAIYVYDLSRRSALRRVTYEGNNRMPVWTSGGERIAFQSDREGDHAIFWQRADGNGAAERLTKPERDETHEPEAWSEANDTLLFTVTKGHSKSLWALSLRTRKATPFVNVQSSTLTGAVFSPDSKWVAYAATEGERRATIYVQPFPPTGIRHQLLGEGEESANHPAWAPDGKELYFIPGPGQFRAVKVTTKPNFAFGGVVSLPRPCRVSPTRKPRAYDVLPDGRFIAAVTPSQSGFESLGAPQVNVVLNWFTELRARVPVSR